MKQLTKQEQKFIELRALSSKSFFTLSLELNVPVETLLDWDDMFMSDVDSMRMRMIDEIKEKNGTTFMDTYKYLSEVYSRLKIELDKRDFSGLPTDKLYDMMDHVRHNLRNMEGRDIEDSSPLLPDLLMDDMDDEDVF